MLLSTARDMYMSRYVGIDIFFRPSKVKPAGYTPRFAQLDKKVLRFFGVFEELLDPAVIGSAPAGWSRYR